MAFEDGKSDIPVTPVEQTKKTGVSTESTDKGKKLTEIFADSEIKQEEVESAKKAFETLSASEFATFLQEFKNTNPATYENALKSIKTSLENFGKTLNTNTNATLLATINSFKVEIDTEIASVKPKTYGETINENFSGFNEFLKNNNINETFGSMFEKTKESFKDTIRKTIGKELINNKSFSTVDKDKIRTLNELGKQVVEKIEVQLSNERMNNFTFGILNKLVEEANKKITTSNGNTEKEIQEKALLFLSMKNIIAPKQKGPTSDKTEWNGISKEIAEKTRMMIQPSTDLITIEKNLGIFIKEKLKEGGLDIENTKKSIREGAKKLDYSTLDLIGKGKRNEATLSVLGGAFENTFSYLDNKDGVNALLDGLLATPKDKNEKFDASKINKTTLALDIKTQPTPEEQKTLGQTLDSLVNGLPNEKTDPKGAENLKEKIANGKFDSLLGQLDNLGPLKGVALTIINWLNNSRRGKSILEFFGKKYGLDRNQLDKILERPFVKSGVDAYSTTIAEIRKKNPEKSSDIPLDETLKDTDIKTDYFKLHNGIVCKKGKDTDGTPSYIIKQIDTNGNLEDYPQKTKKDSNETKVQLGSKTITIDTTGKVTKIDNSLLIANPNVLKYFIESDLNSASFAMAISTMLDTKEPRTKDGIPATNFGNTSKELRENRIATLIGVDGAKIPSMVQELLKNNDYVFSTDDITSRVLEKTLEEYKKPLDVDPNAKTDTPPTTKTETAPVTNTAPTTPITELQ